MKNVLKDRTFYANFFKPNDFLLFLFFFSNIKWKCLPSSRDSSMTTMSFCKSISSFSSSIWLASYKGISDDLNGAISHLHSVFTFMAHIHPSFSQCFPFKLLWHGQSWSPISISLSNTRCACVGIRQTLGWDGVRARSWFQRNLQCFHDFFVCTGIMFHLYYANGNNFANVFCCGHSGSLINVLSHIKESISIATTVHGLSTWDSFICMFAKTCKKPTTASHSLLWAKLCWFPIHGPCKKNVEERVGKKIQHEIFESWLSRFNSADQGICILPGCTQSVS